VIARLRLWWIGLARRERRMVAVASSVVAVAVLYLVAIEPAWLARERIARDLPELQTQLAQLHALREEVRLLREQGVGVGNVESLRAAAEQSLSREGVSASVRVEGGRTLVVSTTTVSAATWFAWMEQFIRDARVRVVHARVARSGSPGAVEAETRFEMPAR
jgi:general secretion pathway protein M